MYVVCGVIMKGYAKDYYVIDPAQRNGTTGNQYRHAV